MEPVKMMKNKTFLLRYSPDISLVFVDSDTCGHNEKLTFPKFIVIKKPQGTCSTIFTEMSLLKS